MIDLNDLRLALSSTSGRLWAMRKEGAEQLLFAADRTPETAIRSGERLADNSFARIRNGVAIIPVRGALVTRFSGRFWSYEEIERDLALALSDERVSSILLEVDSPGGAAAGCDECANAIRAAAEQKPVAAHIESMGASAAFWLASATDSISASPTAVIGSVGVIIRYTDFSGMFERLGATKVEIMATQSPNKSHPAGSEEERAELQPIVDELAEMFIADVAAGRGVSIEHVKAEFGGGAIFSASVAQSRNMIDGVEIFDRALAALADRQIEPNGPDAAAGRAIQNEETDMDWNDVDAAGLQKNRPEVVEEIANAAVASATADITATATANERIRIAGIQENCLPGYSKEMNAAIENGDSPEAFAATIIKLEKAKGARYIEDRKAAEADDAPAASAVDTTKSGAETTNAEPETQEDAEKIASEKWDKMSASEHKEFASKSSFVALQVAEMGFGAVNVRVGRAAAR